MNDVDPNENQSEQGGQNGGASNIFGLQDKLNNAAANTESASKLANKGAEKLMERAGKQTGKRAVKNQARADKLREVSKQLQKASESFSKGTQAVTKLTNLMFKGGIILLIILVAVGLIVFIISGLGMILSKLKSIATAFLDTFENYKNGAENNIHDDEIIDVANALEEMGYDLFGYGFTKLPNAVLTKENENNSEDTQTIEKELVYTNHDTNYAYDYITTYLISDNYAFMVKNNNRNLKAKKGSYFKGLFLDRTAWGSGLISIYYQAGDNVGEAGKSREMEGNLFEATFDSLTSSVVVNRTSPQSGSTLTIESPGIGGSTMTYNLDGWTGRYSIPLEFLLSTHVATMAPDLSYRIARSFNTDVQIVLYESKGGDIDAGVQEKGNEASRVTRVELAKRNDSIWTNIWDTADNWSLNSKEVLNILQETNINSYTGDNEKYKCSGPPKETNIDHISENTSSVKEEDIGYLINNWIQEHGIKIESQSEIDEIKINLCDMLVSKSSNNKINTIETQKIISKDFNFEGSYGDIEDCMFLIRVNAHYNSDDVLTHYEIELDYYKEEEGQATLCSDKNNTAKVACNHCVNYVKAIYSALNSIKDTDLHTYVPYIRKVTDHWYRDVFFSKSAIEEAGKQNEIIRIDEEYENKTEERWTLYETFEEKSSGEDIEYKLYIREPEEKDGILTYDAEKDYFKIQGNYVLCRKTDEGNGKFEKKEDGITFQKSENGKGDYILVLDDKDRDYPVCSDSDIKDIKEFRVEKKAIYDNIDNIWKDENGNSRDTVYEKSYSDSSWKTLQIKDDTKDSIKALDEMGLEFVYSASYPSVTQQEDGVRTATNPTIKNIFLDDYYLYDGSTEKAALIAKAKDMAADAVIEEKGFSPGQYIASVGEGFDYDVENLQHGIRGLYQLTDNNSILEHVIVDSNLNDPDTFKTKLKKSDGTYPAIEVYVSDDGDIVPTDETNNPISYTDYKGHEVTVETQNNKTTGTYQDSSGEEQKINITKYTSTIDQISGPISLSHSALNAFSILKNMHTLDAEYIYHDFKELIVELNYFDKEDLVEPEDEVMMFPVQAVSSAGWPEVRYDKSDEFYGTLIQSAEDLEAKRAEKTVELSKLLSYENEVSDDAIENSENNNNNDNNLETQNASNESTTVNSSESLLLQAAKDISEYMQSDGGYTYSQPLRASSFEASKEEGKKYVDCSGYVSWCLQEVGIFESGQMISSKDIASKLVDYYTSGSLSSYDECLPGTILVFNGHVNIYAGNGKFYDAGSDPSITNSPINEYGPGAGYSGIRPQDVLGYIVIPNNKMTYNGVKGVNNNSSNATNQNATFAGYEGGEPVLAPVTGEVLKYGTVNRKNVITGIDEEVGFIKIRALGSIEAKTGAKKCTYFGSDDDKKGFNYFWKEYSDAGIDDHIMYLEGFDISSIFKKYNEEIGDAKSQENREVLKKYIDEAEDNNYKTLYSVPALVDKAREEELKQEEEDKKNALYAFESDINKKLYIKEGAVIGYTYSSEEGYQSAGMNETDVEVLDEKVNDQNTEDNKDNQEDNNIDESAGEEVAENEIATKKKKFMIGNYMRIIFRDTEEEIIDNVEDYIEIGSMEATNLPDEVFIKYLMSYECGSVYDYLYGNASYSDYLSKFVTEDKKYYKVYSDGLGREDRNFGPGVLHYLDGEWKNVEQYNKVGVNIKQDKYKTLGTTLEVNLVNQVMLLEIEGKKQYVISLIGQDRWDKLPKNQQDLLIDIAYQGWGGYSIPSLRRAIDSGNLSSWGRVTSTDYNNQDRADARLKLCTEGKYIDANGNEIQVSQGEMDSLTTNT